MTLVVDASVVFSALVDRGSDGVWAESLIREGELAAPHLLPVEVASVLRRAERSGRLSADAASMAYARLLDLQVTLVGYESLAERVWELRHNVSVYDALYVALAEALNSDLATLDLRLAEAPGPSCSFLLPLPYAHPGAAPRRTPTRGIRTPLIEVRSGDVSGAKLVPADHLGEGEGEDANSERGELAEAAPGGGLARASRGWL